jgi:hypothetical protein
MNKIELYILHVESNKQKQELLRNSLIVNNSDFLNINLTQTAPPINLSSAEHYDLIMIGLSKADIYETSFNIKNALIAITDSTVTDSTETDSTETDSTETDSTRLIDKASKDTIDYNDLHMIEAALFAGLDDIIFKSELYNSTALIKTVLINKMRKLKEDDVYCTIKKTKLKLDAMEWSMEVDQDLDQELDERTLDERTLDERTLDERTLDELTLDELVLDDQPII